MRKRSWLSPQLAASGLWLAAVATVVVDFCSAGLQARSAAGDAVFPYRFAGLPVLSGFRHGGHLGVHLQPGAFVLFVGPLALWLAVTLLALLRVRPSPLASDTGGAVAR